MRKSYKLHYFFCSIFYFILSKEFRCYLCDFVWSLKLFLNTFCHIAELIAVVGEVVDLEFYLNVAKVRNLGCNAFEIKHSLVFN